MKKGYGLYPSEIKFKYFTWLQWTVSSYQGKLQQTMQTTFYDFEHRVTSLLLQIKPG